MMWSDDDLSRLLEAMRQTGTTTIEVEGDGHFLRLGISSNGKALNEPAQRVVPLATVKSPGLGCFVPCGDDDGLELLEIDSQVRADQVLGYVANGNLREPIIAPAAGRLVASLVVAGQILGYGDSLFSVEETK